MSGGYVWSAYEQQALKEKACCYCWYWESDGKCRLYNGHNTVDTGCAQNQKKDFMSRAAVQEERDIYEAETIARLKRLRGEAPL
jgi:hypothetical protein